jgi:hypothetical protein
MEKIMDIIVLRILDNEKMIEMIILMKNENTSHFVIAVVVKKHRPHLGGVEIQLASIFLKRRSNDSRPGRNKHPSAFVKKIDELF